MNFFDHIKQATENWAIKEWLAPIYRPGLHWLKYRLENKRFRSNGHQVMQAADEALQAAGVQYWLDFGTLLGAVRDGGFIKHDLDIDVGVFLKDHSLSIRENFLQRGFELKHTMLIEDGKYGMEESYLYEGVTFDIFYYQLEGATMRCHLFPLNEKGEREILELSMTYSGFRTIDFAGCQVKIPKDTDLRLRETYGDGYTESNPHWNTMTDAFNAKKIDKPVTIETTF